MTIPDILTRKQHQGNASQTSFPFDWIIWKTGDLAVYYLNGNSVESELTYGVDYTIDPGSVNNPAGGNIDLVSIVPSLLEYITIINDRLYDQEAAYIEGGDFPAEVHETALDKQCRLSQQIKEKNSRTLIMAPSTADAFDSIIPAPVADYCLVWSADGLRLVNKLFANAGGEVLIHKDHTSNGSHIVFENITDLRANPLIPFDGQKITLTGVNVGNLGGGVFTFNSLSTSTDDTAFNIKQANMLNGRWERNYWGPTYTSWFGCVEGSDTTLTLQNAIDWWNAGSGRTLIWDGDYQVTSLIVSSRLGNTMRASGSLTGIATGSTDAVIEIKNCTDLSISGRLVITASYNTDYAVGIKIWGESASGGCSLLQFYNISIVGAKKAWQFGDDSEPDALVSEISVFGGYTFGCPTALLIKGTQTVVNYKGYTLQTNQGSWSSGDWSGFGLRTIEIQGSKLNVDGGEILHQADTAGSAIELLAINSPSFDKAYGSIVASGVTIETAAKLVSTDADIVVAPVGGEASFIGCGGYHSQDISPFIETDSLYKGIIRVSGCKFSATTRTQQTITSANSACIINVDNNSFLPGFLQGLGSYSGGTVLFDRRIILEALDANGQLYPQDTLTSVIYSALNNTIDTSRFATAYSLVNGRFTIPAGGLKSVNVWSSLYTDATTIPSELRGYVNGTLVSAMAGTFPGAASGPGPVVGQIDFGDLSAGDYIEVQYKPIGAPATALVTVLSKLIITARR